MTTPPDNLYLLVAGNCASNPGGVPIISFYKIINTASTLSLLRSIVHYRNLLDGDITMPKSHSASQPSFKLDLF